MRRESTRDLLAGGVQAAATLPEGEALAVLDFLGEKRSFDWIRLDAALLPEPVPAPTDADLQAEHEAHAADRYTRPETRQVSYASITPDTLAASIEIPKPTSAPPTTPTSPSSRPPLAAPSTASASPLKPTPKPPNPAWIPTTWTSIPSPPNAASSPRTSTRAPSPPTRCRPRRRPRSSAPTPPASSARSPRPSARRSTASTPSWPARPLLRGRQGRPRKTRVSDQARQQINDETAHIEDLIAGGATLEEIASETVMELGSVALNAETTGGIADDPAFRQAAQAAASRRDRPHPGRGRRRRHAPRRLDRPAGGDPARRNRDRVAADWTRARTAEALTALAVADIAELDGLGFPDLAKRLDRPIRSAGPLTRGEVARRAARVGRRRLRRRRRRRYHPRRRRRGDPGELTGIHAFDPAAADNVPIVEQLRGQFREQAKDDVLALYTALRDSAGVSVNQALIDTTLSRFPDGR